MTDHRPYNKAMALLESLGGTASWTPSPPGGKWKLELWGRTCRIDCHDRNINDLDRLYAAVVEDTKTFDDYDPSSELVADAPWRLVALFKAD